MIDWDNLIYEEFNKNNLEKLYYDIFKINNINLYKLLELLKNVIFDNKMENMDKALNRTIDAIYKKENITIYGDYDVDGICSTSIIVEFLRKINAKVSYYIPDRITEGYGLTINSIKELCKFKTKLLITVDCGTLSIDEINYANQKGIDVIIIDHHKTENKIHPKALAILNPFCYNYKNEEIYKSLCACGLSFIFIFNLYNLLPKDYNIKIESFLDLTMLATVADMMPMTYINRLIVSIGLKIIMYRPRICFKSLYNKSFLNLKYINEKDIAFNIAPKINSTGRIDDAKIALNWLLSNNKENVDKLTDKLIELNKSRQDIQYKIFLEADECIKYKSLYNDPIIIVYNKNWHPGIIGIVAGKLLEKYEKPVIVIGNNGKGSGRSIKSFDLYKKLIEISKHKEIKRIKFKFGGHSLAIGLSIDPEYAFYFRQIICEKKEMLYKSLITPHFMIMNFKDLYNIRKLLNEYSPFGIGHQEPYFIMKNLNIVKFKYFGNNKNHINFTLKNKNNEIITANKFNVNIENYYKINQTIDILFSIEYCSQNNIRKIQIFIIDLKINN